MLPKFSHLYWPEMRPKTTSIIVISDDERDPSTIPSRTRRTHAHNATARSTRNALGPNKADTAGSDQVQKANPASNVSAVEETHGFTSRDTVSAPATVATGQADCDQHATTTAAVEEGQKSRSKSLSDSSSSSGEAIGSGPRSGSEPCLKIAPELKPTQPEAPGKRFFVQVVRCDCSNCSIALPQDPTCSASSTAAFRVPIAYMGPRSHADTTYASSPTPAMATTAARPEISSPTTPKVSRGGAKNICATQSTQIRAGQSTTQSKSGTPQSTPTNVNPGKRKTVGAATSSAKRTKLANPPPTSTANVGLWSIPAYEPEKDTVVPEEKPASMYTSHPFAPQTTAAPKYSSTEPVSAVFDSNDNAKPTPTTPPNSKPPKKPRSTPWTCAQLADLGNTIQRSVPWDEFAERSGKTAKECLELYSVVVGMPLMDFADKGLNRAKMAKFRERKKTYKDMEKEAKRIHKEEARQEAKLERELAKAGRQRSKAGGAKDGTDVAGCKTQASFG